MFAKKDLMQENYTCDYIFWGALYVFSSKKNLRACCFKENATFDSDNHKTPIKMTHMQK
jgi:hypothetical protein